MKEHALARASRALLQGALLATPLLAFGGAATDGTMGAVQRLSGAFTVPQALGTLKGGNLFHSFASFGIERGESATFTTFDPGIRHVISRVTGSDASLLLGPLRLDAAGGARPDFWFVNPNGITVGAGGSFDVPAGLHLSTAPQLKFADGVVFEARGGGSSSLSVAAPESFGFLGGQSAPALHWQAGNLELQRGSTLQLAGGDVGVQGSVLSTPDGTIRVQAQRAVELSNGAYLFATTGNLAGSGTVHIEAGSLRIAQGALGPSGVVVQAPAEATVATGGVDIAVTGAVTLGGASEISVGSLSPQSAGHLRLRAGSLHLDGAGESAALSVWAAADGNTASLSLDVAGPMTVANGGNVYSFASGNGTAGPVSLRAESLLVDGLGGYSVVGSQSNVGALHAAALLDLQVRDTTIVRNGGQIASFASTQGPAGAISLTTGALQILALDSPTMTGIQSYGGSPVSVTVSGALDLRRGGAISSSSAANHLPGTVRVSAGSATLDGEGGVAQISALTSNRQAAADVEVHVAGALAVRDGGQISSGTLAAGDAGQVRVSASQLDLSGSPDTVTGVFASSFDANAGAAGSVQVEVQQLAIRQGGRISTASLSDFQGAGHVNVRANSIVLDGGGVATGIESLAYGLLGNAGQVDIAARDQFVVRDGGSVISTALGFGSAGAITVKTASLAIDGQGARETYTGIGGDAFGAGAGGAVTIDATRIALREGGQISSATFSAADAGSVRITADVLSVDGGNNTEVSSGISADSGGAGRAGTIDIRTREMTVANEGLVSTSALSSGAGGAIRIDTGTLTLATSGGIFTVAAGSGAAGSIDVKVGSTMRLENGGVIAANTGGTGAAGRVNVQAGEFIAIGSDPKDGGRSRIVSRARAESGGQNGSITLRVDGTLALRDGGTLSIANDAQVDDPAALTPTALTVRAGQIQLADAEINASAGANAHAGTISLTSAGLLRAERSLVRTSARDGDGGPIALAAQGTVHLRDTQVTTSVEGLASGNGGDISLAGRALLLESGFIQANTAAPAARGGRVDIRVDALVPNGNNVFIGGNRIETFRAGTPGYNVIQAAAPDGVGGVLDVTLPQLNLSGTLVGLTAQRIDFGALSRDICQIGDESSFSVLGRRRDGAR